MGILDKLLGGGGAREPAEAKGVRYSYPLDRSNDRTYPPGFDGHIFVWDIDKTYLVSEFDSFKGLLTIPFEFAVDKRNIAGTDVLLRALRRGHTERATVSNPLYFISGSPSQLRGVIERKMLMDGVEYDGITFKDQLAILRSRRLSRIRNQMGYKLSALLLNRRELPWTARECLFGDDSESDALLYSLYGDIVAGRLRGDNLRATLLNNEVDEEDAGYIITLAAGMNTAELVECIYINLEKRSAPSRFAAWGKHLVPTYDSFQMALHLYCHDILDGGALIEVALDLLNRYGHRPEGFLRSALDMLERGFIRADRLATVWDALADAHILPAYIQLDVERAPAPHEPRPANEFLTPMDYLVLTGG